MQWRWRGHGLLKNNRDTAATNSPRRVALSTQFGDINFSAHLTGVTEENLAVAVWGRMRRIDCDTTDFPELGYPTNATALFSGILKDTPLTVASFSRNTTSRLEIVRSYFIQLDPDWIGMI